MTIHALHIPDDTEQPLRVVEIPESESLEHLQTLVEGSFQCINLQLDITCWLNEEGKITGLQYNPRAQRLYTETYGVADILVGPAVLTGGVDNRGSTLGLSDVQLEHIDQLLGPFGSGSRTPTATATRRPPRSGSRRLQATELGDWWQDKVFEHTGDGHGADGSLGSLLTVTVLSGPTHLVGQTYEWID